MRKAVVVVVLVLVGVGALVAVVLRHGSRQQQRGSASVEAGLAASKPGASQKEPTGTVHNAQARPIEPKKSDAALVAQMSAYEKQFPPDLSGTIRSIVGLGSKRSYGARAEAVQKLGTNLSSNDIQGLYVFLKSLKEEQGTKLDLLEIESVRNDVLDLLMRQTELPADLAKLMVGVFRDTKQNEVWRDYCVQHFGAFSRRKWTSLGAAESDQDWHAMTNALWSAAGETKTQMAGTALISMKMLSDPEYPMLDRAMVENLILQLAIDEQCGEPARVTALRLCGELGKKEALPSARVAAQTGEGFHIRLAATATIGDLGDKTDVELLETIVASSDKQLKPCSESALKRLKARLAVKP